MLNKFPLTGFDGVWNNVLGLIEKFITLFPIQLLSVFKISSLSLLIIIINKTNMIEISFTKKYIKIVHIIFFISIGWVLY
jgi:hypothetical protein